MFKAIRIALASILNVDMSPPDKNHTILIRKAELRPIGFIGQDIQQANHIFPWRIIKRLEYAPLDDRVVILTDIDVSITFQAGFGELSQLRVDLLTCNYLRDVNRRSREFYSCVMVFVPVVNMTLNGNDAGEVKQQNDIELNVLDKKTNLKKKNALENK